jgi:hypothetical protein
MKEIFIRHNIGSTPDVIKQLWEGKYIALHYENKCDTNPSAYTEKAAQNSIKRLIKHSKNGAYVGAVYKGNEYKDKILIGQISKGTQIQGKIFKDTNAPEKKFHYKVVKLINTQEVSIIDYPVLASIQPRRITIGEWKLAKGVVEAIVKNVKPPFNVNSMHYGQLEVICYEYLKQKDIIANLLSPIGRTMVDIDILGIDKNGKKLAAQVTFFDEKKASDKINRLQTFSGNAILYFFGDVKTQLKDNVQFIDIKDIFSFLSQTKNSSSYKMLEIMCNQI